VARPKKYDDGLRHRLVEATAEAIAEGGVEALSLRALASAVHTSTNAIYTIFGNRDGLVAAVVEEASRSFTAGQEAVPMTDDASHDLRELGRAYRAWALAHPALYAVMFGGRLGPPNPDVPCEDPLPGRPDRGMAPLVARIERGIAMGVLRPADPIVVAMTIWAGVHGFVSLEIALWSRSSRAQRDALYEENLRAVTSHWMAQLLPSPQPAKA
jgi:AcrR family transcriptional regulator